MFRISRPIAAGAAVVVLAAGCNPSGPGSEPFDGLTGTATPAGPTDTAGETGGDDGGDADDAGPAIAEGVYEAFIDASRTFYARGGAGDALDGLADQVLIDRLAESLEGMVTMHDRTSRIVDVVVDGDIATVIDCMTDFRLITDGGDPGADGAADATDQPRSGVPSWLETITTLERRDGTWVVTEHQDSLLGALETSGENLSETPGVAECEPEGAREAALEVGEQWVRAEAAAWEVGPEPLEPLFTDDAYTAFAETRSKDLGNGLRVVKETTFGVVIDGYPHPETTEVVACGDFTIWDVHQDGELVQQRPGEWLYRATVRHAADGPVIHTWSIEDDDGTCAQVVDRPFELG